MKNIVLLLLFAAFTLVSGCAKMKMAEPIEYVSTPGKTAAAVSSDRSTDSIRYTIEIFPNEIYFGDTIYLIAYGENITTETVKNFPSSVLPMNEYAPKYFTLLSAAIQTKYNWIPEVTSTGVYDSYGLSYSDLQPGEKRPYMMHYFEFPPLEDWGTPFWREMREKMTPDGVKCELRVTEYWFDHALSISKSQLENASGETTQEILIKPRPENEMTLLNKWYKNTPEKLFPKVDGGRKGPPDLLELKSSGRSDIVINGRKYDPWLFIRLGNRKPSDPNNPTTLDGWRKLEASLVPSTMRDEIRLTRLQLEYYSAQKGEASEKAKAELIDWLKSLPEVQQTIMTTFLVSKMYDFYRTSLREQNRELMRSLYDMLDYGCQEAVCNFESINYKDRTLPPPEGVKVVRPFMEVVEPTAEDLVHGDKELSDGFRIWDAVGDTGEKVRMVAKFVELKEGEDTLVLENREKLHFNLKFSALSDEDKQHAREMSVNKPEDQTNQ